MNKFALLLVCGLVLSSRVFAFGIDVGPVHVHGTKVKVGSDIDLTVVVDKIVKDDDDKDRVRKMTAHRKGDTDDVMEIKVVMSELDDDSKDMLKKVKTDTRYNVRLEKTDEDWKLLKIRRGDD